VTAQSEDGPLQVEVAIPLRPRHPKPSPGPKSAAAEPSGRPRIPRITRLMALAIKFQDMVDRGEVMDYADLARLGYVTRARVTQIMNLLLLAPDIQELLLLVSSGCGIPEHLTEPAARAIAAIPIWRDQRIALVNLTRI